MRFINLCHNGFRSVRASPQVQQPFLLSLLEYRIKGTNGAPSAVDGVTGHVMLASD